MRRNSAIRHSLLALITIATFLTSPAARAQGEQKSPEQMLEDFIFFVNTARPDLAASEARALIASGITPQQFVNLVDDNPEFQGFDEAYRQALVMADLEEFAAALDSLYQEGRRARARNPQEIASNIELLKGTARQRLFSWERLKEAGEYAMPALFTELVAGRDAFLRAQVRDLLISMGSDAVGPLVAALPEVNPQAQERICDVLGSIGSKLAVPALAELIETTSHDAVRAAAQRALDMCGGNSAGSPAAAFAELAERYFRDRRSTTGSLVSFPGEAFQLVWNLTEQGDLLETPVRTEVYHETMAMLNAAHALELDASQELGLAVWLAANYARVLDQPAEWSHPMFADLRDPEFYVVAAGSGPGQRALELSLAQNDTLLARMLIGAIGKSAGGVGLWKGVENTMPLAAALSYPDRRVRYEAALVLGAANPVSGFGGADRVVPVLAGAVRDAAARFAVVVASNLDRQQELRDVLEADGYTVLPPADSLQGVATEIAVAPGVDVIVIDQDPMHAGATVTAVRGDSKLAATPVLLFLSLRDQQAHGARFGDDPVTHLARPGIAGPEVLAAVNGLVEAAAGAPVGPDEAHLYASRALGVLHELAIDGSVVFRAEDAAGSLLASLTETTGDVQVLVAQVVAAICQPRAQVALLDAALDAEGDQRIALLNEVVISAHRCGSSAEARHIDRLRQLIKSENVEEATAAAAAAGSLNLPNDQVVPIILE